PPPQPVRSARFRRLALFRRREAGARAGVRLPQRALAGGGGGGRDGLSRAYHQGFGEGGAGMKKIDVFNHVLPQRLFERIGELKDIGKRVREVPMLVDLDERLRVMDKFPDYFQVLCAAMPPIEALAGPAESPELARICNDGLAELCARHPERFPTFIASLSLNIPEACVDEIHRSVKE